MSKEILLIVSSMRAGGAERVAANLANSWAMRGDRVTLLITYSGGGECYYDLSPDINVIYLANEVSYKRKTFLSYFKRLAMLRKIIRLSKANYIISFLTNVNVATIIATIGTKSPPVIVCEHTYPPALPLGYILEKMRAWTYPHSKRVTMLTQEGLAWLNEKIPGAHGAVIPNPIPHPLPSTNPTISPESWIDQNRRMLLAVGRLSKEKGIDVLINAFAQIHESVFDWDLLIIGDGPLRPILQQQIDKTGLQSRIKMPGRAGNVADWYARANLYVMSSHFEGFPNTLGEAMAHGCAAVSFDCDTGPRDIIRHGKDGILVGSVGDPNALATALKTLMIDHATRGKMAENALDVRNRFSTEKVLSLWDQLFMETEN